ncbi:hypothetical protein CLU79DRAFT_888898 [Phycomyces nitens]|nr:hypothetical protein CLU79DRAFT_888898 [Phycomyces nitens]
MFVDSNMPITKWPIENRGEPSIPDNESLHGLLGYSVEVNIFRWPALKRQEFLSSHSRRSRLVMMRLLVPISASLYHTNCLESWWTQEHGCDSGGRPVSFSAGESLHGLLGYSVEVNIFQWPALKRQEFLSSHSRRSRLNMDVVRFVLVSVASGIGWATGRFLAGESLHGLLGYSVEVIIFRMACSKTSRVSELPFTAVKAGHDAFCWSRWSPLFIIPTVWNPGGLKNMDVGGRPVSFSAGESLHGLLGYSVEVNIFQWPALKRQEFLSSHSRRSRLVMMRLLVPISASLYHTNCLESWWTQEHGCDSVVLVSVASGIGWATEFVSSHSRRSRLIMMRLLVPISASLYHTNCLESWWTQEHGCDSVVLVSVASGIGWATGRFSAGESLHGLLGYSVEVIIFRMACSKTSRVSELPFTAVKAGHDAFCWSRWSPLFIIPTVWNPGGLKNMDGGRPVSFSAGESLHGLLGYSVEVIIFRMACSKTSRVSELPFTAVKAGHDASVDPDIRLSLSNQLSGILGGRPVSFLAGESLHGLLGYSVEVNIFRWPALKHQEFLSSHSRRSRLVMMRSVGPDGRLSLSHQLSGIPVDSRT